MLKKFIVLLTPIAALLLLSACSEVSEPKEGTQYTKLPKNLIEHNLAPVTEVFSLTCGHCRSMESIIPQIEDGTGESIDKVHVTFNDNAHIAAMIYYTAVMQLEEKPDPLLTEALFGAVQSKHSSSNEERKDTIDTTFESAGLISPYNLDKVGQKKVISMVEAANTISVESQVNSVPTFIVNGKYLVNTANHQGAEDITKTINFLLKQP